MQALSADNNTLVKTRYKLIDIAAKHIATNGFEGMSLRKVADAAGLTPGAVYRHFPNGKNELYEATLGMVAQKMLTLAKAPQKAGKSITEQLVFQCEQLWDFFGENPNIAAMIVRENINGGKDGKASSPYLEQHIQHIEATKRALERAIENQQLEPFNISAFLFWISSYMTNFHGCLALKEAAWSEPDLLTAKQDFLNQIRIQLKHKE